MIELAKTKLQQLEQDKAGIAQPICAAIATTAVSPLEKLLSDIDPDNLSPREALALLYQLKALQLKH